MSETYRFGDLVEKYIDNRGKTPPLSEDGVPLLEVKHLPAEGKYPILQTLKHVSQDVYNTWFRAHLEAGDILFSTVGTTGRVSITPKNTKVAIAQNVLGLRFKSSLFDPAFAFYYLRSKPFQHEIESRLITTVQASIKRSDMVGIPMHLPEIPVQKAIASLLGALDDKIENNRRMNETLEEMARAIFKSWFVDFDPVHAKAAGNAPVHMDADTAALFPSSFGDDGLPVGWKEEELTNYAILNSKSHSARNAPEEVWYADLANTKNGVIENVEHYIWCDAPSRAKRILEEGDTIVGTVRPGNRSFAYIGRTDRPITGSTGFAVLTPKQEAFREFIYCAATSDENIDRLSQLADGGAYPAVRPNVVSETLVSISSENLMLAFHRQTADLLTKAATNIAENQTLATLRDTLLPKLMSGEIRVADAEREVEAAV